MNDNDTPDLEPLSSSTERVRPGLKGMSWKILAGFLLCGFIPALLALVATWPLIERADIVEKELTQAVEILTGQAAGLRTDLESLHKEQANQAAEHRRASRELNIRKAREDLLSMLNPLVRGRSVEETQADSGIGKEIRSLTSPFDDIVLIDSGSKNVVVTRAEKPDEVAKKSHEQLRKALSKGKQPSTLTEPGWHWAPVGATGYTAAWRIDDAQEETAGSEIKELPPIAVVQADKLSALSKAVSRRTWVMVVALPLLALLLGLGFFVFVRTRLLSPMARVTRGARQILQTPSESLDALFAQPGLAEDLAASLERLRERMTRLQELDSQTVERKRQMAILKQVIDRAAGGNLSLRAEVAPGDDEELTLAVNRLLDGLAERFQAVRQAGTHLLDAAERLSRLADKIQKNLDQVNLDRPADHGALGEILGVEFEALNRQAADMAEHMQRETPKGILPADRSAMRDSLEAAGVGLHLLIERARDSQEAASAMDNLRRDTEVLSTNLAIAAEARSWSSLEGLVESARNLSKSVVVLSGSLTRHLDQIARAGDQLEDTFEKARDAGVSCLDSLEGWQELSQTLERHRSDLVSHVERMRPGASSLANDVRTMTKDLSECREVLGAKREALRSVGESARAVSKTSSGILELLKEIEPVQPVHPAVTRDLAHTQQTLERAMRDLNELAAEGGVEGLSADASAILDQIRQIANQAREKVLAAADEETTPRSDAESGA